MGLGLMGVGGAVTGSVIPPPPPGTLPVVPGAFGFGMDTRAAYGFPGMDPTVFRVFSLLDDGSAGTLRPALEASGPRVVIFEISGTIILTRDITVTNPYLTVAGQTAPSPGITIRGSSSASQSAGGINVLAHDILIQHLRIRPGDGPPLLPQTAAHDASIIYGGPTGSEAAYNIVFDHCSLSWAQDKLGLVYNVPTDGNFTYWRNIFSESLYRAVNIIPQGGSWSSGAPSSLGLILKQEDATGNANISVLQNLFAHCSDRNPEIQGPVSIHFINNVVYDWGKDENNYPWATFLFGGSGAPSLGASVDVIGNVYIAGPVTGSFLPLIAVGTFNVPTDTRLYRSDNIIDQTQQSVTAFLAQSGFDPSVGAPPVSLTGITVLAGAATKASVLVNAGARPLDRDAVDTRIVADVSAYTGTVISSQSAVGGWPSLAVNSRALTLPANPNTVTGSGYTNLEIWLQGFSDLLEP